MIWHLCLALHACLEGHKRHFPQWVEPALCWQNDRGIGGSGGYSSRKLPGPKYVVEIPAPRELLRLIAASLQLAQLVVCDGDDHKATRTDMVVLEKGSEYEWNGKLGSSASGGPMCRGGTYVFARQNLRKFLRLNADSQDSSNIGTDVCPHVGRPTGSDSQGWIPYRYPLFIHVTYYL